MIRTADCTSGPHRNAASGFTLIEMLCALSILTLCMAGITDICTRTVSTRSKADHAQDAARFLDAISVDLTLSASSGTFESTQWVKKALALGWRLDIQQTDHPEYVGLDVMTIHLAIPAAKRSFKMVRIVRSPGS